MATLSVKKVTEVPKPSRVSRAVREQQELFEGFVKRIGQDVGELELAAGEQVRAMKVRLRRAANRIGQQIEIWDADGRVYFSAQVAKRRGRPPKQRKS